MNPVAEIREKLVANHVAAQSLRAQLKEAAGRCAPAKVPRKMVEQPDYPALMAQIKANGGWIVLETDPALDYRSPSGRQLINRELNGLKSYGYNTAGISVLARNIGPNLYIISLGKEIPSE